MPRRSRFSRSSSCAQFAARASSSVIRHSMPRLMSARRPAALRRGPATKPRSKLDASASGRPAARSSAAMPGVRAPRAGASGPAPRGCGCSRRAAPRRRSCRAPRGRSAPRGWVLAFLEMLLVSELRPQRQHHVEHDAHAGERLGRETAARLVGVDDARGGGSSPPGRWWSVISVAMPRLRRAPRPRRWRCRCPR